MSDTLYVYSVYMYVHAVYYVCSSRQQLPLLSMDQAELQRRLEQKVAEMIAAPVESSATRTCHTSSFLPSTMFRQYMADKEEDQTNCDFSSKVGNMSFLIRNWSHITTLLVFFIVESIVFKKPNAPFKLNPDNISLDCSSRKILIIQQSDFRFDITLSRWPPWHHFSQGLAVTWWEHKAWSWRLCSSVDSSWSIEHAYLYSFEAKVMTQCSKCTVCVRGGWNLVKDH